jgi:DNA polymerase III subunit gamma/tau
MSYQVIARKWRPQTFEEVTGQEHITQTLRNALGHDRLHHAYLFSGARGVGKTTTARLLAKALNCHKTDKPNLNPCRIDDPDACPSCVEISESRSLDVLEFDAASNTQVEKIREIILQNINIAPARDRFKVFIIDEVHMLSPSSFNALLKTVEEPPDNVVFIMATTELHKVPETIRSRCQEFDFRTIPPQKIFDRLKLIASAEKIGIDEPALREIARSGLGSMRDAQSNFDQVISFSGEKIGVADVSHALGLASTEMLTKVVGAMSDGSPKVVLDVVADLVSRGQDLRNFCRDLLALIRDLMVFKVSGGDAELVESSALENAELQNYSDRFSAADLVRFFTSLSETESNLKDAVQPRYMIETGLVKLVEMRRVSAVEDLLERLGRLEQSLAGNDLNAPAPLAEKKTLNSETEVAPRPLSRDQGAIDRVPDPPPSEPEPLEYLDEPFEQAIPSMPTIDLGFIDSMPIKLAPIDPELLEHVEDNWLDTAYDRKLANSGDNLLPISNAAAFAERFSQGVATQSAQASGSSASGSSASAAAPAFHPSYAPPVFAESEGDVTQTLTLTENPTPEELLTYAANHPLLRRAIRIFRATIVDVSRERDSK